MKSRALVLQTEQRRFTVQKPLNDLADVIKDRYHVDRSMKITSLRIFHNLIRFLAAVSAITSEAVSVDLSPERFRELHVLDLACGSGQVFGSSTGPDRMRAMEPWFCRIAQFLGARSVIGIDLAPQAHPEDWEFVQGDITSSATVLFSERFREGSFDLVNCANFILNGSPLSDAKEIGLMRISDAEQYGRIAGVVMASLIKVLKGGGVCSFNNVLWKKRGPHEMTPARPILEGMESMISPDGTLVR